MSGQRGSEILRERGYPEEIITAILSHADYLSDRYPRVSRMEKALYARDEITGLITATARLRPRNRPGARSLGSRTLSLRWFTRQSVRHLLRGIGRRTALSV
jgi:predicted hydrolase (HD superfamily)